MTQEDKYWIGGGAAVAVVGGIYWYMQKQKAAATDAATAGTDTTYLDSTDTTAVAVDSGSSTSGQSSSSTTATTVVTKRQPDAIRYAAGQEMMAIGSAGTKGYEAKKMANGQYTAGSGVLKSTIPYGEKIGKIIWVGAYADGTFRYVIQADGLLSNELYWIADYRVIQPIDGSKGISTTKTAVVPKTKVPTTTSSLNVSLVLKKGSKGAEVKELQKRLGITVDGDFGAKTETALLAQKKVSQITLAAFATTNPSNLDFNKVLKNGSKGLEVVELQKRLGFSGNNADGIFGAKTESALFAMKAVKQTTLNQFSA